MLSTHGLLQPPTNTDDFATYYNSTLESREDIEKFVKKLSAKRLKLSTNSKGQYFYRTPFELFSALFDGTKGDASKILRDLKNLVLCFPVWRDLLPELEFLDTHQKVLLYLINRPESIIFAGLSLLILAAMFKTKLKLYQLYQSKSLMSFEVGAGIQSTKTAYIGVFLFADAISYSVLQKTRAKDGLRGNSQEALRESLPATEKLLENLGANNMKFQTNFTELEREIIKILNKHLGLPAQMLLDFREHTLILQQKQRERSEIVHILDSIREGFNLETMRTAGGRLLRLESLGIEKLSAAVKKELIFGKLRNNEGLNARNGPEILVTELPPGLREKYTEAQALFVMPTLEGFERVDSIYAESKKTPETNETATRKHSFEAMEAIPEQVEEHPVPNRPIVLEDNRKLRFSGVLKFVNEKDEYGFFLKDVDKSDVFFHFSELKQANIPLKLLLENKNMRVTFAEVSYISKNHRKSKKAVDIELLG